MIDLGSVNSIEGSGYFCLSHNRASLGSGSKNLKSYISKFKHALLFNKRIALADHMLVNTPNFRISYNQDQSFRELINKDFIDIVFFEKKSDGSFPKLQEIRNFYMMAENVKENIGPLHRSLPKKFWTDNLDHELENIQNHCNKIYPEYAHLRDQYFTETCNELLSSKFVDDVMGDMSSIYRRAYEKMLDNNPRLGIIHFDADHKFYGERNIFEYMADFPIMKSDRYSAKTLEKKFGAKLSQVYRSALINAETNIIDGHAILPKELASYSGIVLSMPDGESVRQFDIRTIDIPLETASLNEEIFYNITIIDISEIRNSNAGVRYFSALESLDKSDESFQELCEAIKYYVKYISNHLEKKYSLWSPASNADIIRIAKSIFIDDNHRELAVSFVINAIAGVVTFESSSEWVKSILIGSIITNISKIPAKPISNIIKDVWKPEADKFEPSLKLRRDDIKKSEKNMLVQYR